MSSAILTHPPNETTLVLDTDVTSFIFKWHPELAPQYVSLVRGHQLVLSFMTVAEIRFGALNAKWGHRKIQLLEDYLNEFAVVHSDGVLCSTWATVRKDSARIGRPISVADAWIAATALELSVPLVTHNPSDFRQIVNLEITSLG